MGALEGFLSVWSNARATMGEGTPEGGAQFDESARLWDLQSRVHAASPTSSWTGAAADSYADANAKQARAIGELAALDQRLRAEVDRSAAVVMAGRRDLETVRQWVVGAAAAAPKTAAGDRIVYAAVSRGSADISDILLRSNTDMNAIAGRLRGIDAEYRMVGHGLKLGPGGGAEDDILKVRENDSEPWNDAFGPPPPPPDSAPGGGRWDYGQGYPPGPTGGPPVGPIAAPQPWHRKVEPPVVGGTSGLKDVVAPPPNGWGEVPPLVLQEAYRFRVVGEGFNNAEGHSRWVQRDGLWHQAQWVGYELEAEHVRQATGKISVPWGFNDWQPIEIKDIYRLQVENPRLTLYVPSPDGGVLKLDPMRPGASLPR